VASSTVLFESKAEAAGFASAEVAGEWGTVVSANPPDSSDGQTGNVGSAHFLNVFGAPALMATLKLGDFVVGAGSYVPFR
jgi:hypothetical protein